MAIGAGRAVGSGGVAGTGPCGPAVAGATPARAAARGGAPAPHSRLRRRSPPPRRAVPPGPGPHLPGLSPRGGAGWPASADSARFPGLAHPAVVPAEKVQFVYLRFFSVAVTAFCRGRGLMPGKCKSWPREGTRLRAAGAQAPGPGQLLRAQGATPTSTKPSYGPTMPGPGGHAPPPPLWGATPASTKPSYGPAMPDPGGQPCPAQGRLTSPAPRACGGTSPRPRASASASGRAAPPPAPRRTAAGPTPRPSPGCGQQPSPRPAR